ncbi:toluene hydroxylase [Bordetella genomosp. 12]|uniref:Toluene hydroxylase n=1 Tax=Bordetella genomosp. 12 TaxID=463035 RepID=A0A261VSM3_9BORD|nr:toluene hydroxylase [Bordetella genomosp. 12]OZI77106.1 toluene hydroxylase [Bordetella genomosp. 12]
MSTQSNDSAAPKQRKMRTFSAFGNVRRMPSEYEIVTHAQNWNARGRVPGRANVFEQNPSSPGNLWFMTYREHSPLQTDDWDGFRDPDQIHYRAYVNLQANEQTKLDGVLEQYGDSGSDERLSSAQVDVLAHALAPQRYLVHGLQQAQAYLGYIAPSSYITNAACYASGDFLRRVTTIAYRTRALQIAHPESGIGVKERELWEKHPAWQPTREAMERALITYDWGEALTALNLVLAPTLDNVLLHQLGEVSRNNGDEQDWLVAKLLAEDSARRNRWSSALARYAISKRETNIKPLQKWTQKWSVIADRAAAGLAPLLGKSADDVVATARAAREKLHAEFFASKPE